MIICYSQQWCRKYEEGCSHNHEDCPKTGELLRWCQFQARKEELEKEIGRQAIDNIEGGSI